MILNGNTIEVSGAVVAPNITSAGAYSTRASETWFQDRCPYGKQEDYTYSKQIMQYNNIALGTRLENIAKSAYISILLSTLPISVITAAIAGVFLVN